MKKEYLFEKKTFSSFQKAFLTKLVGGKYAGGIPPSCKQISTPLNVHIQRSFLKFTTAIMVQREAIIKNLSNFFWDIWLKRGSKVFSMVFYVEILYSRYCLD